MQRRAAAIYVLFFVVVGAGAYGFMGVTDAPTVTLDEADYDGGGAYAEDDTIDVGDRTYTVASVDGSGDGSAELEWTDPEATFTTTLENDTTVSPLDLTWDGQGARWSRTLEDGADVAYADGTYRVAVNTSADPPTATLTDVENATRNETVAVDDTLSYRGNETTVTAIDASGVTLTWGEPYLVSVPNASDPDSVTFLQQFDVSDRLANDPAVYNETVTVEGQEMVVRRDGNATTPLSTYLPEPDRTTFAEGDRLTYEGTDVTIDNVTVEDVTLAWTDERTETVSASEGANVTLGGESYFAHFSDNSTVQILPHGEAYESYQQQREAIDYYDERMLGLWGVVILSFLAAVALLGLAYLPVKG